MECQSFAFIVVNRITRDMELIENGFKMFQFNNTFQCYFLWSKTIYKFIYFKGIVMDCFTFFFLQWVV